MPPDVYDDRGEHANFFPERNRCIVVAVKSADRIAGCIGEIEEVITTSDFHPLGIENLSKGTGCVRRQLEYEQQGDSSWATRVKTRRTSLVAHEQTWEVRTRTASARAKGGNSYILTPILSSLLPPDEGRNTT